MKTRTGVTPISTVLKVKLTPKSSRNQIVGKEGDTYRIKVTAPPVEGKANDALLDFISKKLRVGKGSIRFLSGTSSRMKRLLVTGLSQAEISERMEAKC